MYTYADWKGGVKKHLLIDHGHRTQSMLVESTDAEPTDTEGHTASIQILFKTKETEMFSSEKLHYLTYEMSG